MSGLEVALDQYTHSRFWLLYRWNHSQKGEEKGRDAVHERMEGEFNCDRSQNHHLPVVWLIHILSFVHGHDEGK